MSAVGASVGRVDGEAKVTGTACYVDDIPNREGELLGATVRSPVPRGRIRSIELDPSFDWSGITVVTADDVVENVVQLIHDDQPVLARDRVQHAYEPIALVAAAERERLVAALAHVRVDIEELPAVLDPLEGDDNVQTRTLITKGAADTKDSLEAIDAALASSEVVVRGRYRTHHQEQLYIEPQGMIAWWDEYGVHVLGSLQCPFYVHKGLKRCFGLEADRVEVTQAVTGGGFGGKEEVPTVIALHAALLARKSGRAVRMIYDRTEDIEATTKRHPAILDIETGCDRDGTLRVLKVRALFDAGAYVTLTPVVLSRGVLHAGGVYRWQDVRSPPIRRRTAHFAGSAPRRPSGRSSGTSTGSRTS
jgi:CO/xanthine dehydrogenase Mo-binding subunit